VMSAPRRTSKMWMVSVAESTEIMFLDFQVPMTTIRATVGQEQRGTSKLLGLKWKL